MATFHFELVSPERQLVTAEIAEAILPGEEGDLAALPLHAPLIAQLRPGLLTIPSLNGKEAQFYLRGGFADVGPTETAVLAEYAIPLEELTAERMADEIAVAQAAYDEATTDEAKYYAYDRVERLQSLRDRLGLGARTGTA
jgi:F-type H+-transporting ATPase subunit epsilon